MSKLIAVTGASRGIGRAIAHRFASAGFDIVACARNANDLQVLRHDLEKEFKVRIHVHAADLSDKLQAQGFARFVSSLQKAPDVLVNNAGSRSGIARRCRSMSLGTGIPNASRLMSPGSNGE